MKKMKYALLGMMVLFVLVLSSCKKQAEQWSEGTYSIKVELTGGSGRASIESPMMLTVTDKQIMATVVWSSKNYDLMKIGEAIFYPIQKEGNAAFEIPIGSLDESLLVEAETVAMSEPHLIAYTITFDATSLKKIEENDKTTDAKQKKMQAAGQVAMDRSEIQDADVTADETLIYQNTTPLLYATKFRIDNYKGGYTVLSIADGSRYLVVPEGKTVPQKLKSDLVVIKQPVSDLYLAATSAMSLFDALDGLSAIKFSGTKASGWHNEHARKAMEEGEILYAGKYSTPDYESLLANNCTLAIESTMINHTPEAKEKLEELGIPVFTDWSSYEKHPLGRTEWIKAYAVMLGKETYANEQFQTQVAIMEDVTSKTDKMEQKASVAFFYISSAGYAVVRKPDDYVANMIELAGGTYILQKSGEDATMSGTTFEMEQFYETAKDADFIVYNGTIDGGILSVEDFVDKNPLLADFKAVQKGQVWCTSQNLYQESTKLGEVILEMHQIFSNTSKTKLTYFYKVEQ